MLTIPKGSTSGKVLRLKGRGFTAKDGKRGDQLVQLAIDIPAGRRGASEIRRGMGRRRQPAGRAWGLASARMKELHPQSPEERRKRLARLRARFGKAAIERAKREIKPLDRRQAGRRSASTTTASSMPATSPIWRCSRCFPSSSSPRPSPGCSAGPRMRRWPSRQFSAGCRRMSAACSAGRSRRCSRAAPARCCGSGAIVGLWTAASFIETIRDILRRAYGVKYSASFWQYRLASMAVILASVVLLMIAFGVTVVLSSVHHFVVDEAAVLRRARAATLGFYRLVPARDLVRDLLVHLPGADPGALPDDRVPQMARRVARHHLVAGDGRTVARRRSACSAAMRRPTAAWPG